MVPVSSALIYVYIVRVRMYLTILKDFLFVFNNQLPEGK